MSFGILLILGFTFGIGFGYFVQRAGFCIAAGLGEVFLGRGKRLVRQLLVIFIITSIGFLITGFFSDSLGLKTIGQIRGYGFYNIISGILFGMGIFLNGGCILGTLRQIGEGNMTFIIVLVSFIPGMAFIVFLINPLLKDVYMTKNLLLPEIVGIGAPYVTIALVIGAIIWLFYLSRDGKK